MNASKPSEHPSDWGKIFKTFRWGHSLFFLLSTMNAMTFRFRSLFAAAYSHGEAAAADAPLHTAFSAHFDVFFYRGCSNIYFSVTVVLFFIFGFHRFLLMH